MQNFACILRGMQSAVAAGGFSHPGIVRCIDRAVETERRVIEAVAHDAMARTGLVGQAVQRRMPGESAGNEAGDLHPGFHREDRGTVGEIGPGLAKAVNGRRRIGPNHVATQAVEKDKQKTWPRHGNPQINSAN